MLSNVVTIKNGLLAVASEAVKNVLDDIETAHLFHLPPLISVSVTTR